MQEVYFQQSLDAKGQVLTAAEIRLAVSGPGIEPGTAPIAAIYGRARHVGQLVNLLAKPAKYDLIVSPPQVEVDNGGCAVTLRFAKTADAVEPPLAELTAILRPPLPSPLRPTPTADCGKRYRPSAPTDASPDAWQSPPSSTDGATPRR